MAEGGGNALREVFARFGVQFDTGPLVSGNNAVNNMESALRGLGNVVAGAAIVQGIRYFVDDIRQMGTEIDRSSDALGLSTRELQEWRAAAASAGVNAEQLNPAIQALRRNAAAAALGAAGMRADFRRLGVSLRDENGQLRSTGELLNATIEGLASVEDPTRRAGIAMRLLGEQGARLGPLFNEGAEGVEEARHALEELGGGLSEETIESAAELTRVTQRMDLAFLSLRGRIALFFMPALARATELIARAAGSISRLADRGRLLETVLVGLGVAAVTAGARTAAAWVAAAAPFVALGVAILGLILIVEDLWVAFEGGDSVFADLAMAFEEWRNNATGGMRVLADVIDTVFEGIRAITASLIAVGGLAGEALGFGSADDALALADDITADDRAAGSSISFSRGEAEDPEVASARAAFTPEAFERWMARRSATSSVDAAATSAPAPAGPTTIDRHVEIGAINTTGMTPAAAEAMTTRAIDRALGRTADDLAEGLGEGEE